MKRYLVNRFSFVLLQAKNKLIKQISMTSVQLVGFLATTLSVLSQIPQAIKVFRTQDTHSISLVMYCIVVVAITLWLVYGIILKDAPLIWANTLSLVPIVYIFIIKLKNTIQGKDKLSI